ncbi:acetoin dehydrogenase [Prescottella equi]|uniref:SDR family NAD(P)-dependent oxidoreductase n=1 Tax=Rhodococcus hoagii TaxID=43767 RepID=UPI0009BD3B8A|nr:SDR family NAD(P)-dependent oxidoreductase [Prescottella equi]OQQ30256.1 acetoin dehydrogenase [Prescottella equi]
MEYFDRRVVAVTGAGSGIGRELALRLAQSGASLALADVDSAALDVTAETCRRIGADVATTALDVIDRTAVAAFATDTVGRFGGVDVIVNNAGVLFSGNVVDADYADLEHVVNVDFWGVVNGTKEFLPHILKSERGHIVNLSSAFGLMAAPGYSAYNAAKFAVRGFTESLRQEMESAGHRVKVTCVYPGGVRTPIARTARIAAGVDHADVVASFEQRIARTDPADAARTILRGVERGRPRVLVGPDARVVDVVTRILGPGYQWLLPAAKRLASR